MLEQEWLFYLKKFLIENKSVIKSKDEDCAIIKIDKNKYLLITTDALVEGVHFDLGYTSFWDLGVKTASVNLSDISACGGEPKWALLTIGSPYPITKKFADEFMKALVKTLEKYGAVLVGGDTVKSSSLFFNLTLIGETRNPVLRSTASKGDLIFVSRPLGKSSAFLRLIKNKAEEIPENLKKAHLQPEPEVELGLLLSKEKIATAMIDISDGFALDLWRLCSASQTGAEIYQDKIPVGKNATLEDALFGGEDYALLFTVNEKDIKKLKKISQILNKTLYFVGKILEEKKIYLVKDNNREELKPRGFDHFVETSLK
jgi:thiamine-monophosphate kinase